MESRELCNKVGLKRTTWTPEEDEIFLDTLEKKNNSDSWNSIAKKAGLQRGGRSCRKRWLNFLRPGINRDKLSLQEEETIIQLHARLGNRWNEIAAYLPKRTGSHVRNYWTTKRRKRLTMKMGMNAHENSYMGDSNSTITVTNHQDNNMMISTSPNSSWMMENSNACSMFNHENSYMGNSSSTIIVTSHQDNNMMNSTSPNSSCIDHLIDYPTLPLSLDESTYANTGCLSTTSLGLARSQVEIPRFGSAQETNAVDPNIVFSEYNLSDNLDFPSTLEQYISHGPVCGARENSFMGDSSSTSPKSSYIDHLIDCPTLPMSLGESTYANTGYLSTTSLGLSRSQVEIPVTPSYQQPLMGEYPGIDMNNYNTGGSAQETNANIFFPEYNLSDDLDFLGEQYISHGPVCGVADPSEPDDWTSMLDIDSIG